MTEFATVLIDRFSRATGWRSHILMLLTGGGIALGQAPFGLFALAFASMCLAIFLAVATPSARHAARRGWMIGFGFALVTFLWIVEPFLVDIARHGWMAPFALLLMSGVSGVFWAAGFWAARWLNLRPGIAALAVAVFLTAAELVRAYALTGFPWALTSYVWIDTPIYQLAAFIGPHGLTLATFLLAAGFVTSVLNGRVFLLLICAGLAGMAWFGGDALRQGVLPEEIAERPVLRLIQPNANQRDKWDPEMIPVFYQRQLDLSAEKAETTPDLVIWPEVAVAFLLNDPSAPLWEISDAAGGVPVILGGQRLLGRQGYNSLGVLGPGGGVEHIYDKHHLVPFGEYVPGEWLLSRIGLKAMTAKFGLGYSAGEGPDIIDLGELGKVLPLICYEAIFPHEMRQVDTRPEWMLILTNDAWFGEIIGPFQHLAQAKARAIEFALPMVRVANTGVSAVFDGKGRLVDSLPLGVSGRLDVQLPPTLAASLYWKTGDIPTQIAVIVLLSALIWRSRRNGLTRT